MRFFLGRFILWGADEKLLLPLPEAGTCGRQCDCGLNLYTQLPQSLGQGRRPQVANRKLVEKLPFFWMVLVEVCVEKAGPRPGGFLTFHVSEVQMSFWLLLSWLPWRPFWADCQPQRSAKGCSRVPRLKSFEKRPHGVWVKIPGQLYTPTNKAFENWSFPKS